jgi:hypothetical protein
MQNAFAAGQDALLNFLAKRDAQQRLMEDRARRSELDAQEASFKQQQLANQGRQLDETAAYRQDQIDSLAAGRAASADAAKAGADSKRQAAEEALAPKARLEAIVADESADPNLRKAAQFKLLGITPTADVQTGRDHMAEANSRMAGSLATSIEMLNRRNELSQTNREASKDSPSLPTGTKDWINSLAGKPIEAARAELQAGWRQQRAAHPHADLAEAAKYLDSLYTQESDIGTGGKTFKPKFAAGPAGPKADSLGIR